MTFYRFTLTVSGDVTDDDVARASAARVVSEYSGMPLDWPGSDDDVDIVLGRAFLEALVALSPRLDGWALSSLGAASSESSPDR